MGRTGQIFKGWSISKTSDKVAYEPGAKYTENKDITLYGVWEPVIYTIKYNANGGKGGPKAQTKKYNEDIRLSSVIPTRAGYKFLGWSRSASSDVVVYKPGDGYMGGDITLYAQWGKEYKVTFNANGGKVSTKSKKVTTSLAYGTLPKPTRNNHTFKGWYTAKTGGTKITTDTKVKLTKNQTLYAQWNIKTYTVKFNANKGTSGTMKNLKTKHGETKKLTTNTFKRKGYTFAGWNTKANGKGKAYKNKASIKNKNLTLYAQWKKIVYTVEFKGNGNTSGAMKNLKIKYGENKKLSTNAFKRKGYTFAGWNTKANGKGTAYKNKASVKNRNLTLYAQWRKKK